MSLWNDLAQALQQEVELLEKAVDLSEQKRQALVDNSLTDLDKLVPREAALANSLQHLEPRLTQPIGILAGQHDCRSLGELIASSACPNAEQLRPLYERMVVLLAALQGAQEQNRLLIEQSLAYIDYSLKLFANQEQDPAYTSGGKQRHQKSPRLVDRKM